MKANHTRSKANHTRRARRAASAVAVSAALVFSAASTTPAEAAGATYGCPSGAVCVYPRNAPFTAGPERGGIYYSYGNHNFVNELGYHRIFNNQYGGAGFKICLGYNGRGCSDVQRSTGGYQPYDLTGINSLVLVP
jgi:hypothetical protein